MVGEYQRGSRETAQRILGLVDANNDNFMEMQPSPSADGRVPRGTARPFVEKCLREGPATISEIRSKARTPIEKMLSYQTVRLELLRGFRDRRYKKNKKKFSIA